MVAAVASEQAIDFGIFQNGLHEPRVRLPVDTSFESFLSEIGVVFSEEGVVFSEVGVVLSEERVVFSEEGVVFSEEGVVLPEEG